MNVKKFLIIFGLVLCGFPFRAFAQDVSVQEFLTAQVKSVQIVTANLEQNGLQSTASAQVLSGADSGNIVTVSLPMTNDTNSQPRVGDKIVVIKVVTDSGTMYTFDDYYRIPGLIWIGVIFLVLILILGRWRGLASLLGLGASIGIIVGYIIPRIIAGDSPLVVSIIGSIAILFISIYVAHGIHWRTTIAVVSTAITLTFSAFISS